MDKLKSELEQAEKELSEEISEERNEIITKLEATIKRYPYDIDLKRDLTYTIGALKIFMK